MTPLAIAYVAITAVCIVVALERVTVWLRVPGRGFELLLAAAALAVAGDSVVCIYLYQANTPRQFLVGLAWSGFFLGAVVGLLSWFVDLRTRAARRWLVVAETVVAAVTIVFSLSVGIVYTEVVELRSVTLPWGEVIRMGIGPTSPWRWIGDLANVGFLALLIDTTLRLARRGVPRVSWLVGGSLVVFSMALLFIIPIDFGVIELPGPHTFAFLLIIVAGAWDLSDEVASAAVLSRQVRSAGRRWSQLLDNVQLLVVGLDRDGVITSMNRHAEQVTGYSVKQMVGRHYLDFVPETVRDEVRSEVDRGLRGDPPSRNERPLITRDGERRLILWRSVVLWDADGAVEGLLSVGADVTEQRESEGDARRTAAELEGAVAELEDLKGRLEEENLYLREEIRAEHGFENIIGGSDPLLYVLHKVRQVAPNDTSVLILGETGVGKELIARTIHDESPRSSGPFVVVNCAALPPNLIESELFGHERGAFTGAERQRRGRFELAHGGTIFLDEIGELSLEMQPKLLRVLQEGQLERVGGTETVAVDVRVIAATNRNLSLDMEAGRFREDLFYRIAVYPITVPPLGARREDIPLLVEHFVQHFAQRRGLRIDEIPAEVMRHLRAYDWPGNVRELQNVIERAVLTTKDRVLRLAEPLKSNAVVNAPTHENGLETPSLTLDEVERRYIVRVLEAVEGQVSGAGGAAEILGLHANTLRYRMKKLGISVSRKTGTVSIDSRSE